MTASRDRSARISALVVIGGLLIGALAIDATDDDGGPPAGTVVEAGIAMPAARPDPTLASTWYCAAGTDPDGFGDHVLVIANPSDRDRSATITALAGSIAPPPATVAEAEGASTTAATEDTAPPAADATPPSTEVALPARSRVLYRVGDLLDAPLLGAIVEADGGDIAVEHELSGDLGRATAPCSTTVSSSWSFPWGVTTRGNRELLVFMNPFPDDATVDVSFATDEGVRDSAYFTGFVVPGRSVVGAYVDDVITRKEEVAAEVTVRGGRLVVDRVQTFTGVDGREGITVGLGAPTPADTWIFPDGLTGPGLTEQIVVYNPTDRVAEAQVEVRFDDPDAHGVPEPFELTVPPGRYAIVNLHEEERIVAGAGHSTIVASLNGVPLVAERAVSAREGASRRGVSSTLGAPLAAPTWYFPAGGTSAQRDEFITLFNASDDEAVTYSVTALVGGQTIPVGGLQDLTLAPSGRASLRIGNHLPRDDIALVVSATGPIVAERGLYRVGGDGMSQAMGIPLAVDVVVPESG